MFSCDRPGLAPPDLALSRLSLIIIFYSNASTTVNSVKTGLSLGPWANVVIDLRVEIALHDILLVGPIVCACPTAWGIGNLHQTAAVEEKPSILFYSHVLRGV